MSKVIGKLTLAFIICLISTVGWTNQNRQNSHTAEEPGSLGVSVKAKPPESPQTEVFNDPSVIVYNADDRLIAKAMLNKLLPDNISQIAMLSDPANGADASSEELSDELDNSRWMVDLFGGVGFGDDQGELYTTHLSFQKGSEDKFGIAWQPFTGFAVGQEDTSGLLGLDMLLKFPIFSRQNCRLYFEGGAGIQYSGPKSWPNGGSHFNWRPQFGFGMRVNPNPDQQMVFGVRYMHISNGGTKAYNCNVDEIFLYGGIRIRF